MRSTPRTKPASRSRPGALQLVGRDASFSSRASSSSSAFSTAARSPPGFAVAWTTNWPPISRASLEGADVGRDLVVVDQPLVEPRASCRRPARSRPASSSASSGASRRRRVPDLVDARLRHAVLRCTWRCAPGALRDPGLVLRDRRPGRDVAEVLLDPRLHVRRRSTSPAITSTAFERAVVGLEPLLHVVERGGVEVLHRADHRPGVRVALRVDGRLRSAPRRGRRARSRPAASRSARRRAARRASPGRSRRAGGPCGPTPSTARCRARATGTFWK